MKKAWEKWKVAAVKIGDFQFKVLFSIFYFILITPFGLVTRAKDFLKTREFPGWQKMENNASSMGKLKSQ